MYLSGHCQRINERSIEILTKTTKHSFNARTLFSFYLALHSACAHESRKRCCSCFAYGKPAISEHSVLIALNYCTGNLLFSNLDSAHDPACVHIFGNYVFMLHPEWSATPRGVLDLLINDRTIPIRACTENCALSRSRANAVHSAQQADYLRYFREQYRCNCDGNNNSEYSW